MKTKITISNEYSQLSQEIDMDITPEEMLDLMWIVLTTVYSLDVAEVRMHLEMLKSRPAFFPEVSEELTNV